jgi:hypothetical protein
MLMFSDMWDFKEALIETRQLYNLRKKFSSYLILITVHDYHNHVGRSGKGKSGVCCTP